MPKNGLFGHNTPFWGIFGLFRPSGPPRRRGFYINPRQGARGPGKALRGLPETLRTPERGLGPGPRDPGWGPRGPPGGSPGPGEAWDPVPGVPDTAAGVVLHQPLAPAAGSRESGIFSRFPGFWPKLAKFGVFAPVATGAFSGKVAKNGHFQQKCLKMAFLAIIPHFGVFLGFFGPPGLLGAGVLHQPPPGRPGAREGPPRPPGDPPDPGEGSGTRSPGSRMGSPGSPRGLPWPGGGLGPGSRGPGHRRGGGFTSTPRAGAPRFPAGVAHPLPGEGAPGAPERQPPPLGVAARHATVKRMIGLLRWT